MDKPITQLLWDKKGKKPIGSVRCELGQYDPSSEVIIPYDSPLGTKDFIVMPLAAVVAVVNKKRLEQEMEDVPSA